MKLDFLQFDCVGHTPTMEEISEYRNEQDLKKRLNLAYEYQITKDDLYPEDYHAILDDVYEALREFDNET